MSRNPIGRMREKGIPREITHKSKSPETLQDQVLGSRKESCVAVGGQKKMMLVGDGWVSGEGTWRLAGTIL